MWRKAESTAINSENQIKFKSVKRESGIQSELTNRMKVFTSKPGNTLNLKKSNKKMRTIDPKNAENELK